MSHSTKCAALRKERDSLQVMQDALGTRALRSEALAASINRIDVLLALTPEQRAYLGAHFRRMARAYSANADATIALKAIASLLPEADS